MRRRKLLIGVGGLAGGSGILGTGAFTSVSAERSVSVSVADDDAAFLKLTPSDGPNGGYATTTNGQLALDFTETDAGGGGLGTDSTYRFDNVFEVTNQGTQPVGVWLSVSGSTFGDDNLWFYQKGSESTKLQGQGDGIVELDPGAGVSLGVYIDTHGLDTDTWDVDVTVQADATVDGVGVTCPVAGEGEVLVSNAEECGDFSSIDDAVQNAEDGDTVLVHDYGTYSGTGIRVEQSDLTIKGANGRKPRIEQGIVASPIPADLDLTLENLRFQKYTTNALVVGTGTGDFDGNGTGTIEVRNCDFAVDTAISLNGVDIDTLRLSNIDTLGSLGRPISCGGSVISTLSIENCLIRYVKDGVKFGSVETLTIDSSLFKAREDAGANAAGNPGIDVEVTSSGTIRESTVQYYSKSGLSIDGDDADIDIEDSAVLNNGLYWDDTYTYSGIVVDGTDVDVDITGSNIVGNSKYGIEQLDSSTGSVVADGCHFRDNDAGEVNAPVTIENRVGDGDESDEIESAGYQWD